MLQHSVGKQTRESYKKNTISLSIAVILNTYELMKTSSPYSPSTIPTYMHTLFI